MSDADEHEFRAEDEADIGDADQAPEDDAGVSEKRRISRDVFDEDDDEEDDGEEEEEEELSGKKSRKRAKVRTIVFFTQTLTLTWLLASSQTPGSQSFH